MRASRLKYILTNLGSHCCIDADEIKLGTPLFLTIFGCATLTQANVVAKAESWLRLSIKVLVAIYWLIWFRWYTSFACDFSASAEILFLDFVFSFNENFIFSFFCIRLNICIFFTHFISTDCWNHFTLKNIIQWFFFLGKSTITHTTNVAQQESAASGPLLPCVTLCSYYKICISRNRNTTGAGNRPVGMLQHQSFTVDDNVKNIIRIKHKEYSQLHPLICACPLYMRLCVCVCVLLLLTCYMGAWLRHYTLILL